MMGYRNVPKGETPEGEVICGRCLTLVTPPIVEGQRCIKCFSRLDSDHRLRPPLPKEPHVTEIFTAMRRVQEGHIEHTAHFQAKEDEEFKLIGTGIHIPFQVEYGLIESERQRDEKNMEEKRKKFYDEWKKKNEENS